jgi:hypothetical protein
MQEKDMEVEALRKELQEIRKQLESHDSSDKGKKKPATAPKVP